MNSSYHGKWSGIVTGSIDAKIHVRIEGTTDSIRGYCILISKEGHTDIVEFCGKEVNNREAELEITNFTTDGIYVIEPNTGRVTLTVADSSNNLKGSWSTNIGTKGELTLTPTISKWIKIQLSVPVEFHNVYRRLKKWFFMKGRFFYLLFVILIAFSTLLGLTIKDLTTMEAIIFILPLPFLFRKEIKDLLVELGITKAGPFEFKQGGMTVKEKEYIENIKRLQEKFGGNTQLFFHLSKFFVQKTKLLLGNLAALSTPISKEDFFTYARELTIPEENISVTLDALLQTRCLKLDEEGKIHVEDLGREFLSFETIINKVFKRLIS